MRIYKDFIAPSEFIWPDVSAALDRSYRPEVPDHLRVPDNNVLVKRIEENPDYYGLRERIFDAFKAYAPDRYQVNGIAMIGCTEFHKGSNLAWHKDHHANYCDDRILTMSIQIQAAELGGGIQFQDSAETIQIGEGDAMVFDARRVHRSVRVIRGVRRIIVSFATGVKLL